MSAEADDLPTNDAITRIRFRLDGLKETVRRLWAAMHGDPDWRPKDYEEDVAERVARIISRKYGRWHVIQNGDGGDSPGNGEKALLKWILGITSALLVVGIAGNVAMYGKLSAIAQGQEDHEHRISRLEAERDRRAQPGAP